MLGDELDLRLKLLNQNVDYAITRMQYEIAERTNISEIDMSLNNLAAYVEDLPKLFDNIPKTTRVLNLSLNGFGEERIKTQNPDIYYHRLAEAFKKLPPNLETLILDQNFLFSYIDSDNLKQLFQALPSSLQEVSLRNNFLESETSADEFAQPGQYGVKNPTGLQNALSGLPQDCRVDIEPGWLPENQYQRISAESSRFFTSSPKDSAKRDRDEFGPGENSNKRRRGDDDAMDIDSLGNS